MFGQAKIQHFYLRFHRRLSLVSRYFQPNGMASRRVRRDSYETPKHAFPPFGSIVFELFRTGSIHHDVGIFPRGRQPGRGSGELNVPFPKDFGVPFAVSLSKSVVKRLGQNRLKCDPFPPCADERKPRPAAERIAETVLDGIG